MSDSRFLVLDKDHKTDSFSEHFKLLAKPAGLKVKEHHGGFMKGRFSGVSKRLSNCVKEGKTLENIDELCGFRLATSVS